MMDLQMIGIDHSTAGVEIRERFSFTPLQAERALQEVSRQPGIRGCVLLSTCNRTELYVSVDACEEEIHLPALLKRIRVFSEVCLKDHAGDWQTRVGPETEFEPYFRVRRSEEAVRHLFYLTAGLKSRILGEDQILTQVKEAVKKSRELYCTDTLLEVLFRHAVTAGKEVKTEALSAHADISAVHCALAAVERQGFRLDGKSCLVIGNGQMGKLAAEVLRDAGASVTVTVRQYRSGIVEIPKGCGRIHYGERYERIPACDLVLSATVSPNLTIRKEPLAQARGERCREQVFIDLAVPRDMEEEIAQLEGVTLYDIDDFQSDMTAEGLSAQKEAAEKILVRRIAEFKDWYECRDLIPRMQQVGRLAAEEICWRMGRGLRQLPQKEQEMMSKMLKEAAQKVVDKLLYTLRDELPGDELQRCLNILEHIRY